MKLNMTLFKMFWEKTVHGKHTHTHTYTATHLVPKNGRHWGQTAIKNVTVTTILSTQVSSKRPSHLQYNHRVIHS